MTKSLYEFCFKREEYELLAQRDKEKNEDLMPRDVAKGSYCKVWGLFKKGYEWQVSILSRTDSGNGCQ